MATDIQPPVVIYARYSSHKQDDGFSIQGQLEACDAFARQRGFKVVDHYIDEAISGTTDKRDAFQQLIDDSSMKTFKHVLVWNYKRFSRNRYNSVVYKKRLEKNGVSVISITEPVEFDGRQSALLESIYEGLAEEQSRQIAADTVRGMESGARLGFWQSGRPPYGYRISKVQYEDKLKNKLEPDPLEAPVVRQIFDEYLSDRIGVKGLVNRLSRDGVRTRGGQYFSVMTVKHMLCNPIYIGDLKFRDICVEGAHTPIIDHETYYAVQSILSGRKTLKNRPSGDFLLSGLVRCAQCGGAMSGVSGSSRGKTHYYYKCVTKVHKGSAACTSSAVKRESLERSVLELIEKKIFTEQTIREVTLDLLKFAKESRAIGEKELSAIRKARAAEKKRYDKLIRILTDGDDDTIPEELRRAIRDANLKIEDYDMRELKVMSRQVEFKNVNLSEEEAIEKYVSAVLDIMKNFDVSSNAMLKKFVVRIDVGGEDAVLHWNFPEQSSKFAKGSEWLPLSSILRTKTREARFKIYDYRVVKKREYETNGVA
jgi:DNA invertase Pin-like site-specific DNA recombinase